MRRIFGSVWFIVILFLIILIVILQYLVEERPGPALLGSNIPGDSAWNAPSLYFDHELEGSEREMVIYGEALVEQTSRYLGPNGSVRQISNGMNCQNCHLDAGTRPWGNNYGAVASTYPKFRARSGSVEDIPKRVNDCFERSLNGQPLDSSSYEMRSIVAYLNWLGKDIQKGSKPHGSGLAPVLYLDRAADPLKGKEVYAIQCQSCHGVDGEGVRNPDGSFLYPPLWGTNSYNDGAGLYRISKFASYIKSNMPFNLASHASPKLTDEEAWDVAAFVNSQPRPHKDQSQDWKDISQKAVDEPFGPYADGFTEKQHKYGPFKPIEAARTTTKQGLAKNQP